MNPIYIVGAGPGALDLMTVRASEIIKAAEVLIWTDSLISPEIPKLAPKGCESIKTSSLTLEEILDLLISKHKQNKKVVRLHDGDPCLFGALSEQIQSLTDSGIEVEVIPGISAYQATAAALKSELTIPDITQTIILTRSSGETIVPHNESLEKLASTQASLCLYLSARHVEKTQEKLLNFYPANTPVAIGYRVSWKDQWLKIVPLDQMASESKRKGLIRTTIYIVSPAMGVKNKRSKLYSSEHAHIFRPSST